MTSRRGFAAIISVIIISAVLMASAISLSLDAFEVRMSALDAEDKVESRALAEACARKALIDAELGASETGIVTVDAAQNPPETCVIRSVTRAADGSLVILAHAEFPERGQRRAATDLKVTAQSPDFAVQTWQELPDCSARAPPDVCE